MIRNPGLAALQIFWFQCTSSVKSAQKSSGNMLKTRKWHKDACTASLPNPIVKTKIYQAQEKFSRYRIVQFCPLFVNALRNLATGT